MLYKKYDVIIDMSIRIHEQKAGLSFFIHLKLYFLFLYLYGCALTKRSYSMVIVLV